MKYFGTDGIRGIVEVNLNKKLILKIANGIVRFYKKHKLSKILLVGNDSRISADYILSVINSVLLKSGIEVHNIGSCSSPCLAYICKKFNYPLGLMISASHNPYQYNGLKFFNSNGEKISEVTEQKIEYFMDKKSNYKPSFSCCKKAENLKESYIQFLKQLLKNKTNVSNCVFDCSCGGTSEICKLIFKQSKIVNANPNGQNINKNCGCTNLEYLRSICLSEHKLGFAFDGDGDRIMAVDEHGNIFDGDKIMYILAKFFLHKNDVLVGTIYTNMGLENWLTQKGIILKRVNVGDKNVYKLMQENGSLLGGENAGHIIFKKYSNTGDGVLISIILLNILEITKCSLNELIENYVEYYQANDNLKLQPNFKIDENTKLLISKYTNLETRIIIRPSGTEPILRIMVENKNKETALNILSVIKNSINQF